nr:ABC transporter ATP-binding protein [uncultured Eisenbergiella sp.]
MIELRHVGFRYEGTAAAALTDICLTVETGECVVLTGKSGCGKTTITRLVNGLIPYFYPGELSGCVKIDGQEVQGREPHELAEQVGSVFQNPRTQFFNTDTDSEMVFGMENCGVPYEEMHRRYTGTVKDLSLQKLCRRDIFALSGGEKQSIAFGSVYALSPDIYVLDEPSANLDREAVGRLRDTLLHLKRRGKTILISEHRLFYLRDVADRAVMIDGGRNAGAWNVEQLAGMPLHVLYEKGLRSLYDTDVRSVPAGCPVRVPALEVRRITVKRKKKTVLDGVNLTACRGEIVGVTGPNGIGKTTLARVICGLMREKSGAVYFDGLLTDAPSRKRYAFLVMQDPNYQLFSDSVEHELDLTLSGERPDEAKKQALLEALDLESVRKCHPLSLSGGQKQRLCIVLAALSDAPVLLLDEPTSGLDYRNMRRTAGMLMSLAKQGKAIVVISHDNEFLDLACTRIVSVQK